MAFFKKTVRDVPVDGKIVLVRVDYNVPLAEDGSIADDFRIRASLPTLRYLLERGCKLVLISHLGRPDGTRVESLSLENVASHLSKLLDKDVHFCDSAIGDAAYQAVKRSSKGSVTMLENLRFYPGEEQNDAEFARQLVRASGAQYFVQDGFSVLHRKHASTDSITMLVPSVAGLLVEREYTTLITTLSSPERPFVVVVGGAKVADKIGTLKNLAREADTLLVGGMVANNFLAYRGKSLGLSRVESSEYKAIQQIYEIIDERRGSTGDDIIVLPSDLAIAKDKNSDTRRIVSVDSVPNDEAAYDIGDVTIEEFSRYIDSAKTVLWNGPLGYEENPVFAHGSARMALGIATRPDVVSVIGGGDTADFVLHWDARHGESFSLVSTGGGAGLSLLADKRLVGVDSLLDA